jgi:hypothetical protein
MSKHSDHNLGQKDGARANTFDEITERFNPFTSPEYKQGFQHAIEQQTHASPSNRGSSNDSRSNSGSSGWFDCGDSSSGSEDSGSGSSGSTGSGCFLSTACIAAIGLPDNCVELCTLRRFRDEYVAAIAGGHSEITHYYKLAPKIVAAIDQRSDSLDLYGKIYDFIVSPCVRLIADGLLDEAFKLYKVQTQRLSAFTLS